MIDMTKYIKTKSDQLNADDLIGADLIAHITDVKEVGGDNNPIHIDYKGAGKRIFKPCKTVRRLLIALWGKDGSQYIGKSILLTRDPNVIYSGQEVGGIRIKAASDIKEPLTIALSEVRGKKKLFVIQPLGEFKNNDDTKVQMKNLAAFLKETITKNQSFDGLIDDMLKIKS